MDAMKPGLRTHGPASLKLSYNTSVPAHLRGGLREISHLRTEEDKRGQGHASLLLQRVCAEADAAGVVLMLMPAPFDDGGPSLEQLVDWYSRYGFRPIQAKPVIMARAAGSDIRVKMRSLAFHMQAAMGVH